MGKYHETSENIAFPDSRSLRHATRAGGGSRYQQEPIGYGAGLLCLGLVLLANGRARNDAFNQKNDE